MIMRAKHNKGFTLMELLVVIAITMILMGLVMAPVVKSFELTRRAQAMVEAQDAARQAMQQITREVGEAMDVLDYTADPIQVPMHTTGSNVTPVDLPYAKIDLVLPKMLAHCNNPAHTDGEPRDFEVTDIAAPTCPVETCKSPDVDIRPKLPLEAGPTVVRYFLGLKYNNPHPTAINEPPYPGWESPWSDTVEAGAGNQVVLYRIEFDPRDEAVFSSDLATAVDELQAVLKDPYFFYNDAICNGTSGDPYWKVWAERARIIGVGKYEDLVTPIDTNGDGTFEALSPSVTFRYGRMDKDTFTGVNFGESSADVPNSVPTVYRAQLGCWTPNSLAGVTDPFAITVNRYPNDGNAVNQSNVISYVTGLGGSGGGDLVINKVVGGAFPGTQIFNITQYMANGCIDPNSVNSDLEMAFFFDYSGSQLNFNRGTVNFAMNVRPMDLGTSIIELINNNFKAAYTLDRGTAVRHVVLDAMSVLGNATVVPGSEVITGPDMNNPINSVRYQRVPLALGDAGRNQYKIDYQTGVVYFSPVYDQDLPTDGSNMTINYKIQFNRDGDTVLGDYQTKAKIDVHVGIRMYDPNSAKPHIVELNNSVKVRNAYR